MPHKDHEASGSVATCRGRNGPGPLLMKAHQEHELLLFYRTQRKDSRRRISSSLQRKEEKRMARCDDLATQLTGLQNQLAGLQNQLAGLQNQLSDLEYQRTHPNEACADQGLTGIDCELYLRGLGPQIRSTESQISGVQGQISGVQAQISNVQQQQQNHWCLPVFGADGTPLTITLDDQGNVMAAQAVGTDGVKRSFKRTSSFNQNKLGLYAATTRQEFFENDVRYFYETYVVFQDARKVSYSASGGGKSYGFSVNFPSDGSQTQIPITIVSGVIGQQFTVTTGTLYLNQGSLAAPSYSADLAMPPEIQQQTSKVPYFQSVFDQERAQYAQIQASVMQDAGISTTMSPNEFIMTLYALTERRASQLKGALLGLGAFVGGIALGAAAGPAALVGVAAYLTQRTCDIIDFWVKQQQQLPPQPAPAPTPPAPSVPMDDGDPMPPGGDPGGQCIGPPVTTEQGGEVAKLSAKQRVIVPFDDSLCF